MTSQLQEHQLSESDRKEKLWSLIKGTKFAMLTTLELDNSLRSRPMATLNRQDFSDGCIWFFTRRSSHKTAELQKSHHVNLAYSDPSHNNYVSVSGLAEVVDDREKASQLWNEYLATWFPQGLDDPELALLRVNVTYAEYWDAPSSTMVHAFGYLKAKLTGKSPKPGHNEKLHLGPSLTSGTTTPSASRST